MTFASFHRVSVLCSMIHAGQKLQPRMSSLILQRRAAPSVRLRGQSGTNIGCHAWARWTSAVTQAQAE